MARSFTICGGRWCVVRRSSTALRSVKAITRVVVHHTVMPQNGMWERVAKYHVNSRGWPGIGYHLGLHTAGRVSLLNDPTMIAYHAGKANGNSLALAVMGNFEVEPVSDALWARILHVVGVVRGHLGREVALVGHRDLHAGTACPGKFLHARIAALDLPLPARLALPEDEPVAGPVAVATAVRWWAEEWLRLLELRQGARAEAVGRSLVRLAYRLEGMLRDGKQVG